MIPVSDPKADGSYALRAAAHNGHVGCVRLLLPESDPKERESSELRGAAGNGHAECARLLLPVSDPKAKKSAALRRAAESGHAECVRLLLPVSDAKAEDSFAIRWAGINGHEDCARLLLAASGPLGEIEGLLKDMLDAGQAKVAALLVEEDSRILDGVDLSKCLADAHKKGHGDLAAYLSSIMEQRALGGVAQNAARRRQGGARL